MSLRLVTRWHVLLNLSMIRNLILLKKFVRIHTSPMIMCEILPYFSFLHEEVEGR